MPPKSQGLHEVRTRVICHLPVNNAAEENAFFEFVDFLSELHQRPIGVNGFTHSAVRPVAFYGYWWPDGARQPVRDRIIIFTIDYLLELGSREISASVKELKNTIRQLYRRYGSPQDEIWVVAHPIVRQD